MKYLEATSFFNKRESFQDTLYRNSFLMMLTYFFVTGIGFAFWMLAARVYNIEDVGIASALISSVSLLVIISKFGLDYSLIRFFSIMDKTVVFNTSIITSSLISSLFGFTFVYIEYNISSSIFNGNILRILIYIIFLIANILIIMIGNTFIAMRRAEYNAFLNLIMGSRLLILIAFTAFGAFGIFGSIGLSLLISSIVGLFILSRFGIKLTGTIDREFLRESFAFSAPNYLIDISMNAPSQILPIIVIATLGAKENANYYIVYSIVSFLLMIPASISTSLMVEGCYGANLNKAAKKSLALSFLLLIPIITFIYIFGDSILYNINKDYLEGSEFLRIMILTGLFTTITYIYFSIKRVQNDLKGPLLISGLILLIVIGTSQPLMRYYGLVGVGYAWLAAYGASLAVLGIMILSRHFGHIEL